MSDQEQDPFDAAYEELRAKLAETKTRLAEAEAALRAIEEQANKWIGECCGTHAERFCENFGCQTMKTLTEPCRTYFEKWGGK